VHLVRRGHFRSHGKNGGHTIRSAISKNPIMQANFTVLSSIKPELLPIEVLHCRIGFFVLFCSYDLGLDQMTFIYKFDSYSLEM